MTQIMDCSLGWLWRRGLWVPLYPAYCERWSISEQQLDIWTWYVNEQEVMDGTSGLTHIKKNNENICHW